QLRNGNTVVCDRYYHSSMVYQPALGAERAWVRELNRSALRPDLTVVLDISSGKTMERIEKREHEVTGETVPVQEDNQAGLGRFTSGENIFENLSFQQKVVRRYRQLPDRLDEPVHLVDSEQEVAEVFEDILQLVEQELDIS
ncbi:MAG: dTMP kinase, partial [Candidatus Nanohaloarchaea archaeon]